MGTIVFLLMIAVPCVAVLLWWKTPKGKVGSNGIIFYRILVYEHLRFDIGFDNGCLWSHPSLDEDSKRQEVACIAMIL